MNKWLIRACFALPFLVPAGVLASGRIVVRSHVVHPYVQPVLAAQYVPVPVAAYSVGMQQQLDPALLERIAVALEKIAARGPNGEINDLPPEPEYVGLVRQNCASCHGITPKGNKLAMFDSSGRFKTPSPELLGDIIAQVSSGAMPKAAKMDANDRLKLISGLTAAEPTKGPQK